MGNANEIPGLEAFGAADAGAETLCGEYSAMNYPNWVEVDLAAISHNVRALKSILSPGAKLLAVVKADAYGHGMVEVATTAIAAGAEYLGVAHLIDAINLKRRFLHTPVLAWLWEPVSAARLLPEALKLGVEITINSKWQLETLARVIEAESDLNSGRGKPSRVHLKVDTGMGRSGIMPAELSEILQRCQSIPNLQIVGLMSHLYNADASDLTGLESVDQQAEIFKNCLAEVQAGTKQKVMAHLANSAATLSRPDLHFDLVRCGIALYGYQENEKPAPDSSFAIQLKPALSVKSRISLIKTLPAGHKSGYGGLYTAQTDQAVAVVSQGYADGLARKLSAQIQVAIHTKQGIEFAPQIGRISMDQIVLALANSSNAEVGDEVTLWGAQNSIGEIAKGRLMNAANLAELSDTISYEILTSVSSRLPRIYRK